MDNKNYIRVFVYGSLREGCGNHRMLISSVREEDSKVNNLEMYSNGAFPYCIKGKGSIVIESYLVSEHVLRLLDGLEGHPDFYRRMSATDTLGRKGFIYIYQGSVQPGTRVESGDWAEQYKKIRSSYGRGYQANMVFV